MGAVRVLSGMITSTRLPSSANPSSPHASSSRTTSSSKVSVVDPCPVIIAPPPTRAECCPLVLYTAEGAEAAVHRHDHAVDKARARPAEPDQGAHQLLWGAEASC